MTAGINTNLQSILNQAKSTCSNMFSSGSVNTGSSQYVNSIFSLINEGEQAINGGDQQKAQAITNMVQNLLSMLSNLSNEKSKAVKEGKQNSKAVDNTSTAENQTANDTKQGVEQALKAIDTSKSNIQDALDKLKVLSGDDGNGGELAVQKDKLQKILDEIEAQQKIVNDGVSSIDAKNAALEKIKDLSGQILVLESEITNIQKSIDSLSGIVEDNAKDIEAETQNAANVVEDGANKLQSHVQQASQEQAKNVASSTEGTGNIVAGTELTTGGTLTKFVPGIGQAASSKAIQIGKQLIEAGGIRLSDSASNIAKITTALGKMASDAGEFQGALGNVVGSATQATDLIGQYGTVLNPAIEAIGSWVQVADANKTLTEEIEKADKKLNGEEQVSYKPIWQQTQNTSQQTQNVPLTTQSPSDKNEESKKGFEQQGSNIFNFDRKQFGI